MGDDFDWGDDVPKKVTAFVGKNAKAKKDKETQWAKKKEEEKIKAQKEKKLKAEQEKQQKKEEEEEASSANTAGAFRPLGIMESLRAKAKAIDEKNNPSGFRPYEGSRSMSELLSSVRKRDFDQLEKLELATESFEVSQPRSGQLDEALANFDGNKRQKSTIRSLLGDTKTAPVDLTSPDSKKNGTNSEPRCPRCGVPVTRELLDLDDDLKIHTTHEKEEARKEWKGLKIPEIDWDSLGDRCDKYFGHLEDITRGKIQSPFKEESFRRHSSTAPKSAAQQIAEDFQWCSPGYFGRRGAEVMSEQLTVGNIRFKKLWDEVQFENGFEGLKYSDYVVEVLVPELATRIIMEDMKFSKVNLEKGREFLRLTQRLGHLLNDEEEIDMEALKSEAMIKRGAAWMRNLDKDDEDEDDYDEEEEEEDYDDDEDHNSEDYDDHGGGFPSSNEET